MQYKQSISERFYVVVIVLILKIHLEDVFKGEVVGICPNRLIELHKDMHPIVNKVLYRIVE
jgi:hypothetical protein